MMVTGEKSVVIRTASESQVSTQDVDPIRTEVIRHGLEAAADHMKLTLRRTAFSPIIYEILDAACALFDREGRLLAQAHCLPLFLGTLSFAVDACVNAAGGEECLEPGDVIFSTYGYEIGSHQQDAVIVVPGFHDGDLVGYAAVKAHLMDIGAKDIYCTDTTDIFQEGTIYPSVKIQAGGVLDKTIWRVIIANSRMPEALGGDINAMISAARTGLSSLSRLIERYGLRDFSESTERMFDHGEAMTRRVFADVPDGVYSAEGAVDDNGISDERVAFKVSVEIVGSEIVIDLTDAPPQQDDSPLNCPYAASVSAARLAIMNLIGLKTAATEGHFRPISVRLREGTIFHAKPPAALFLYYWPVANAVDVIHRALADAMPAAVTARSGGDLCPFMAWGELEGGSFWATGVDHNVGQGATVDGDGTSPLIHIPGSGVRNSPVEVWEASRPVVIERYDLAADSGGAGKFRGGPGVDVRYRNLRDYVITPIVEQTKTPPWGLFGGLAGRANRFRVFFPDGRILERGKATALHLPAGTVCELNTGGGGGYGPPAERSVEAVMLDISEGYISTEAARRDYPHAFSEE